MKIIICTLSITLAFLAQSLHQKGEIADGYIIDHDDQRKDGFVVVRKQIDSQLKVKFSEDKNVKKYPVYRVRDIKAYGYETTLVDHQNNPYQHWRHFHSYEFERPARIMSSNISLIERVVENGYYTVSVFKYETGGNVDMPITIRYIVFCDGAEIAQVELDNFEIITKDLFGDYTALTNSLGEIKFRFGNFVRLVEDYNFWIESMHDPNIYKMNPKIFNQKYTSPRQN